MSYTETEIAEAVHVGILKLLREYDDLHWKTQRPGKGSQIYIQSGNDLGAQYFMVTVDVIAAHTYEAQTRKAKRNFMSNDKQPGIQYDGPGMLDRVQDLERRNAELETQLTNLKAQLRAYRDRDVVARAKEFVDMAMTANVAVDVLHGHASYGKRLKQVPNLIQELLAIIDRAEPTTNTDTEEGN